MQARTLDAYLNTFTSHRDPVRIQIAAVIRAFADAALQVRKSVNEGALGAAFAEERSSNNAGGDTQKDLDVYADNRFIDAARRAGVGHYASEELANPVELSQQGKLAVAIDPLDGSSNIDTNVSIGTIFSILPRLEAVGDTFSQPGRNQLAAGFFIYGPQLALALTKLNGTRIYVFSSRLGTFVEAYPSIAIPRLSTEFAVNASNYRHWDEAIRLYVDDCLAGTDGPRDRDFNMRWIASLVADAYRILIRGGVFLYPRDNRKGYSQGRLRLVYEANPMALLMEQAGGHATDGLTSILDLVPTDLHQRTPLVFGSRKEVEKIKRYHGEPSAIGNRHPLFGNRGLFRA
ncbi:class 1 fructose-bisphosphatase [Oricola cellulosilytica]|uniref:Fructose-1,6-bisphosphatase class 1 n=1 Tax=Oricola cellulosilytica TaxID=1429082 RepID=A0A4R0PDR8_9HYPH|nr:class 1 fructose-bisphosphatase [Oricola cellulosilytica]TCD13386.1 class 1 fructose-bisphosphatase [Oricola cellulosilytica]